MKKVILGVLSWIIYSELATRGESGILHGAIIALVLTSFILGRENLRKGFILDWCTVVFFAFVLIVGVYLRHPFITQHPGLFSDGALAVVAIGSLLVGIPFTIQYAREQTAQEHWNSPNHSTRQLKEDGTIPGVRYWGHEGWHEIRAQVTIRK